ncbi:MAG: hypothetical protein V4689_12835 [Verrucomicrobiota bacterium]
MIDKQAPPTPATYAIPVLSSLLHHLAMPVVVFWRYHFGFSYLRQKKIFYSCIWASFLLTYVVWHSDLKDRYGSLAVFFCLSSALYLFHLSSSFRDEIRKSGKHDQYSGDSHLLRFRNNSRLDTDDRKKLFVHFAIEPALTVIAGILLSLTDEGRSLGSFLIFSGLCLFLKEGINAWLTLRRGKRHTDLAHDIVDEYPQAESQPLPSGTTTRQPKASRRSDVPRETAINQEERKHAETLRLLPPYTLVAAVENYRVLIKEAHPDFHGGDPEATAMAQNLNEAMEYFRNSL